MESDLTINELLDIVKKQKIIGNIQIIDLENNSYNDEYIVNMWLNFVKNNSFNFIEIYEKVKSYFEILIHSKEKTLIIVPNNKEKDAILIIMYKEKSYCFGINCEEYRGILIDMYLEENVFGNLIAIYFLE